VYSVLGFGTILFAWYIRVGGFLGCSIAVVCVKTSQNWCIIACMQVRCAGSLKTQNKSLNRKKERKPICVYYMRRLLGMWYATTQQNTREKT
jgi:hypothetical protein